MTGKVTCWGATFRVPGPEVTSLTLLCTALHSGKWRPLHWSGKPSRVTHKNQYRITQEVPIQNCFFNINLELQCWAQCDRNAPSFSAKFVSLTPIWSKNETNTSLFPWNLELTRDVCVKEKLPGSGIQLRASPYWRSQAQSYRLDRAAPP